MSEHTASVTTVLEQQKQLQDLGMQTPSGDHPSTIGRYRVERLLGQGSFGRVYLAFDEQLQRLVAIKVPHRHRIAILTAV